MKFACLLVTVVWLSQDLACRPTLAAESQPTLELKPDPDSLLELTHWTTHGFQEAGIHQAPDKAVFELAPEDLTISEALNGSSLSSTVVFVTSKEPPQRRKQDQPFVTIISNDGSIALNASNSLPVTTLNKAVTFLEGISGRRLYPYRLIASSASALNTGKAPYVIYDVSRGEVHISKRFVQSWADFPEQLNGTLHNLVYKVFGDFQMEFKKKANPHSSDWMGDLVGVATAAISSGLMAAVRSKPPVWFCFVCPIVLGEFFPFFFNLGLGHIAQLICERYKLPDEECLDLWLGAVALALVLSLSSVVAIISICRIRECAKPIFG